MSYARTGITNLADKFVAITPSDSTKLMPGAVGMFVGGAGNVAVQDREGGTVTFTAVPAGTFMPISPFRVMATNTTATLIIALY